MPLAPIYTPQNVQEPAYHLRYAWSGWPSASAFPPLPPLDELKRRWEAEGLRLLEQRFRPEMIQFTFSVKPAGFARVFRRSRQGASNAGPPAHGITRQHRA